jgi:hypothetical protein
LVTRRRSGFAERVVEGLFDRYAATERAIEAKAAAERDRRLGKFAASNSVAPATEPCSE